MARRIREATNTIAWVRGEIAPLACPECASPVEITEATIETPAGSRARVTVVSCSGCEHVHENIGRIPPSWRMH